MTKSFMKQFLYFLFIILFFSSCGYYKRFTYLQTVPPEKPDSLYAASISFYKLQPADILHVKVSSLNENINKLFDLETAVSSSALTGSSGGGMYLMGYSIDKDGFIALPILGKVPVAGLTMDEARDKIQKLTESYISEGRVDVKLVSFKISMLGEVHQPGQYSIFNDRANIFEAISLAGDVTYNGNRRRVYIVRNFIKGSQTIKIDLTQRSILSSAQYYLQPNDIVYVEPLKSTAFRLRVSDYSVFITLLTSTITAVLLITQALNK
jgi:polysaccharide biosynthesis/export protein